MTTKTFCDGCDEEIEGYVVNLRVQANGKGCMDSQFFPGEDAHLHERCFGLWFAKFARGQTQ